MVVQSIAADDYITVYHPMAPQEDAERWDKRYAAEARQTFDKARSFLITHSKLLPSSGLAIDLAMGLGGNAELLLNHGLSVIGIDISSIAVEKAKKKLPSLMAVVADLTDFDFPPASFDLVTNFFYLERSLWGKIPFWLKPGGLLVAEVLMREMLNIHPEIPKHFLLEPGELKTAFPGLETLIYEEGWYGEEHIRATARLIARKPVVIT